MKLATLGHDSSRSRIIGPFVKNTPHKYSLSLAAPCAHLALCYTYTGTFDGGVLQQKHSLSRLVFWISLESVTVCQLYFEKVQTHSLQFDSTDQAVSSLWGAGSEIMLTFGILSVLSECVVWGKFELDPGLRNIVRFIVCEFHWKCEESCSKDNSTSRLLRKNKTAYTVDSNWEKQRGCVSGIQDSHLTVSRKASKHISQDVILLL